MRYTEGGYTVLEVMIFLAISAFLLAFTIPSISGQQARTYFTQGVRDFDSKLQDVLNDISTGYFDNSNNLGCQVNGAGEPVLSGTATIGTSEECILLGKALWVTKQTTGTPPLNESISIYNIVAGRVTSSGVPVASLGSTRPIADDRLKEVYPLQNGLQIRRLVGTTTNETTPVYTNQEFFEVAALMSSFNGSTAVTTTNRRSTNIHPKLLLDSDGLSSPISCVSRIFRNAWNSTASCSEKTLGEWRICVSDNARRHHAEITLHTNQSNVTTSINFEVTCP